MQLQLYSILSLFHRFRVLTRMGPTQLTGHIIKRRSALTLLPATLQPHRQGDGCLCYFFRVPPFCFVRRRVVFVP